MGIVTVNFLIDVCEVSRALLVRSNPMRAHSCRQVFVIDFVCFTTARCQNLVTLPLQRRLCSDMIRVQLLLLQLDALVS